MCGGAWFVVNLCRIEKRTVCFAFSAQIYGCGRPKENGRKETLGKIEKVQYRKPYVVRVCECDFLFACRFYPKSKKLRLLFLFTSLTLVGE